MKPVPWFAAFAGFVAFAGAALFVMTCAAAAGAAAQGGYAGSFFQPSDRATGLRVAAFREAGRSGDRTQIPDLLAALNKDVKKERTGRAAMYHDAVVLHSLAQLGATEALPFLELIAREVSLRGRYANLVRARLIARSAVGSPEDKVRRFLAEMSMTVEDVNGVRKPDNDRTRASIELSVLRELADMIYHKRDLDLARAAQALGIRFAQDAPSALKVRLAPLSQKERVDTLIKQISEARVGGYEEDYLLQLAANEGTIASRAAAARLKQMMAERSKHDRVGLELLIHLIWFVGDKDQVPLLESLRKDPEPWVGYNAANALPDVRTGVPYPYIANY